MDMFVSVPQFTYKCAMLIEEWQRISVADIQRLILSFPRKCQEVFNARSGHTRY